LSLLVLPDYRLPSDDESLNPGHSLQNDGKTLVCATCTVAAHPSIELKGNTPICVNIGKQVGVELIVQVVPGRQRFGAEPQIVTLPNANGVDMPTATGLQVDCPIALKAPGNVEPQGAHAGPWKLQMLTITAHDVIFKKQAVIPPLIRAGCRIAVGNATFPKFVPWDKPDLRYKVTCCPGHMALNKQIKAGLARSSLSGLRTQRLRLRRLHTGMDCVESVSFLLPGIVEIF